RPGGCRPGPLAPAGRFPVLGRLGLWGPATRRTLTACSREAGRILYGGCGQFPAGAGDLSGHHVADLDFADVGDLAGDLGRPGHGRRYPLAIPRRERDRRGAHGRCLTAPLPPPPLAWTPGPD